MMIFVFIRHGVADYVRWKEIFDSHLAARQAGGATRETLIMRNVDDLNEITILLGWQNLQSAHTFTKSVSLQVLLRKAGDRAPAEIQLLELIP